MGEVDAGADDAHGGHNADQNGGVEARALLAAVGGCEVDQEGTVGEGVARIFASGAHPLLGLLDGGVGQTDQLELREAVGSVHLDADGKAVNAEQACAIYG